nr:hypothetical protein B0A51_17709 [Rachicladosporium sp. CCFEE 5018]
MSDDNTTIGAGNNILSYHHASPEYTATAIDQFLAAADEQYLSASSDSGASDRSFPVTPPDTQSDMYEDINFNEFVDPVAVDALGNTEFDFSSGTGGSWRADTPPSSPPYDYSSPLDALSPPSDCAPMQDFELMGGLGGVMQYLEQPNYVGFEGILYDHEPHGDVATDFVVPAASGNLAEEPSQYVFTQSGKGYVAEVEVGSYEGGRESWREMQIVSMMGTRRVFTIGEARSGGVEDMSIELEWGGRAEEVREVLETWCQGKKGLWWGIWVEDDLPGQ